MLHEIELGRTPCIFFTILMFGKLSQSIFFYIHICTPKTWFGGVAPSWRNASKWTSKTYRKPRFKNWYIEIIPKYSSDRTGIADNHFILLCYYCYVIIITIIYCARLSVYLFIFPLLCSIYFILDTTWIQQRILHTQQIPLV